MKKKLGTALLCLFGLSAFAILYIDTFVSESSHSIRQDSKFQQTERIAVARKNRTKFLCQSVFGAKQRNESISLKNWLVKGSHAKPRLFYGEKLKLLVCDTPKCGSSEWRNLVLITDKIVNFNTSDQITKSNEDFFDLIVRKRFIWRVFGAESANRGNKSNVILNDYFKVMTVREPLERLVSAYKDKLETNRNPFYAPISRRIHKKYGNGSDGLATFDEFIQMIIETKYSATLDVHWMPYTDLCDPCQIRYDYIAKMETIDDDVSYLSEKIGFDKDIAFTGKKKEALRNKWDTTYFQYYKQLAKTKRKAIFEYYKTQYDLFGYEYPELDL